MRYDIDGQTLHLLKACSFRREDTYRRSQSSRTRPSRRLSCRGSLLDEGKALRFQPIAETQSQLFKINLGP